MKFEVDFTQEEYEALAQIAKRFGRTSNLADFIHKKPEEPS